MGREATVDALAVLVADCVRVRERDAEGELVGRRGVRERDAVLEMDLVRKGEPVGVREALGGGRLTPLHGQKRALFASGLNCESSSRVSQLKEEPSGYQQMPSEASYSGLLQQEGESEGVKGGCAPPLVCASTPWRGTGPRGAT